MAAADQSIINENLIKQTTMDTEVPCIPVPVQRKHKQKTEDISLKKENLLSVSAIIDNSRVVFLNDDDITRKEVHISKESHSQESIQIDNSSETKEHRTVNIIRPMKSMVASFVEKFNAKNSSSEITVTNTEVEKVENCDSNNITINTKTMYENVSEKLITDIVVNSKVVEDKNPSINNGLQNTVKLKEEPEVNNMGHEKLSEKSIIVVDKSEEVKKSDEIKIPIPAPRTFIPKNNGLNPELLTSDKSISTIVTNSEVNLENKVSASSHTAIDTNSQKNDKPSDKNQTNNGDIDKNKINDSKDNENNKILSQTKPTISKKPTTLNDMRKIDRAYVTGKIPIFEKSTSLQDSRRSKGLRSPAERNFDFEPKLTKKQRTSSEQCLSSIKTDSEVSMINKLKVSIEQAQNENATLKKLLESERSAFREQKAVIESELRKEKAESKRKEASLESQLRAALKGQTTAAVGQTGVVFDNARYSAALESAKTTIKALQEKLRVAIEADKKKATELKAQYDAHTLAVQQMERDSRAQTTKLLEELKAKDREIEKIKKEGRVVQHGGGKPQSKMAAADQLHQMEGQISRLENEIQRRDDIIQSLRTSKVHKDRRLSQRSSKDNIFKDILSDVDSAVSSAPNSLSPQPSPDLWYRHQDAIQVEVEENLLEAAKKQIQELEKALNLTQAGQKQAQQKVSQLEEQLQDLREQADLLEFRCLELEDSAEKRHCMEELTDSDSGCTSPENRLKNSVSPQLRRSDSGYKSPTRSASPTLKSHHRVVIPPAFSEPDMVACTENYKTIMNSLHLQSVESIFENGFTIDEVKDKIEEMLLTANSDSDRLCLQQLVQLLWNLQTLRNSLNDDGFSMVKSKKSFESDVNKCDFDQQTKSGKIIATVSPYSQKTLKSNDLSKSASIGDGDFLNCTSINQESKKVLFGLQESGIFEEGDWESKSTQTDCYDCACPEPESDLATEVLRLNQIREQLEKSGAIKNKVSANVCSSPLDLKQQRRKDRKKIELYENRIAFLENKLSIYESSDNIREKKLAQRLQRELDLQTKVKNLEFDLDRLKRKYIVLEEEKCEFEEAENDTRLHCQELEAEFDILSAKLRDIDDQRNCARNEAECYRQLVEEYEYKIMTMQQNEDEMKQKADIVNQVVPVLVSYNIYCLLEELTKLGAGGGGCNSGCTGPCSTGTAGQSGPPFSPVLMLDYEGKDMKQIGKQLACLAGQGSEMMSAMQQNNASVQNERKDDKGSQYEPNVNLHSQKVQQAINTVQFEEHATNTAQFDEQTAAKLKMRIEELEKRELAYLETLTKGDEMWAEMEASYKHKLKELEENETQLITAYNKLKTKFEDKEKKIHEMEETEEIWRMERKAFMDDLREVKKLKDNLERKNNRLKADLAESRHALEEKERQYQSHISLARNREDSVREELAEQKRSSVELESEYNKEVNTLKRDLRRTAEELNQYKDSVRDLTEVVKTLRENLTEVEFMMNNQKNEYEEKSKSMLTEIKSKNDEVRLLRESIDQLERLPSAHEELEDVISRDRNNTHLSPKKPETSAAYQARTSFKEDLSIIPAAHSNQRYTAGPVSHSQNNDCVPNIWDEQVTTLITIKAIKGPGSGGNNARHSRGGNDDPHHPDRRQPSPYRDRRGGNYSKDDHDGYGKRDNHVSFRHDDCDILYENVRARTSRMTNDSDINLVDFSSSTGSVPFNYRAKYSPESFDFTSRDSYDQGRCRCSIQNPNDSSNTPRSHVVKSGENKRSCSCPRAAQPEEPKPVEPKPEAQGTCTCCQNKGNNGSRPFEGRPIPLLLIPTSGNQKSKNSKGGKASERKSPIESEEQEKPKSKSEEKPKSKPEEKPKSKPEEKPKSKPEEKPKKPEVPSRKPKPAVAFKPTKKDYELRVPPLHLKEDVIEPTDAIERKYILCHQQIDKMEINSLPKNPTCSMATVSDIERSEPPTESSVKNITNKSQPKTNTSFPNIPGRNKQTPLRGKQPAKVPVSKKNRIERPCMVNKKETPVKPIHTNRNNNNKCNLPPNKWNSPTNKCNPLPNKLNVNVKNRKGPSPMVHFESNFKVVQECSVSYETRKNVKRTPILKNATKKLKKPPSPYEKSVGPKSKSILKKAEPENPFLATPQISDSSDLNVKNDFNTLLSDDTKKVLAYDIDEILQKFLSAPLPVKPPLIEEVYDEPTDSDLLYESIADSSENNYSMSTDYDMQSANKLEVINESSKTSSVDDYSNCVELIAVTKSNDSNFDVLYENKNINDKSLSKMSVIVAQPSANIVDSSSPSDGFCSRNSVSTKVVFSGYMSGGVCYGVKSLPSINSVASTNSTKFLKTSPVLKRCEKSCSTTSFQVKKQLSIVENALKLNSSLDRVEKCENMSRSRSILKNAENTEQTIVEKYYDNLKSLYNKRPNVKISKCKSFNCMCDLRNENNKCEQKVQFNNRSRRVISDGELAVNKLKLYSCFESENCAFKDIIKSLHSNETSRTYVPEDQNDSFRNMDLKQEFYEESTYETSSKEVFSLPKSRGKKGKTYKIKRKLARLSTHDTKTKVTIKMRKSQTIHGRMTINNNLGGFLSKINADIVSAVGIADRRAMDVLSEVSLQLSDTLFKMKALQESSRNLICLPSPVVSNNQEYSKDGNNQESPMDISNHESYVDAYDQEYSVVANNQENSIDINNRKHSVDLSNQQFYVEENSEEFPLMHETPLASELESLNTSLVDVCHLSPVPSPRKRTNSGIKRYHSLTESVQSYECESLPPVMSHSDSGVSYNSITAKELIASFNNISEGVKPEKCTKSSYKSVIQPKSIGSFVFDRVTKLTNGLSNPKVAGLKRSVSMVADSKPQPATFYADL